MCNYGYALVKGLLPGQKDAARGVALVQQSAALGHPFAHFVLGAIEEEGMVSGNPDAAAAVPHYQRACELGSPEANWSLGNLYRRGASALPRAAAKAAEHYAVRLLPEWLT
jgi:TPR repeat protein